MKTESTLSNDDRRLIDQIRRGYAPPPMTDVDRARFDARMRARIERQRRRRWGAVGLTLAGAAAAAALFALGQPAPSPTPNPGALPEMAALPAAPTTDAAVDTPAVALDWLIEDSAADWLGGSTVLPSDPLLLTALGDDTGAADDDGTDDALADETDDDAPAWMPDEYTVLAGLIDLDPYDAYDTYEEDWP